MPGKKASTEFSCVVCTQRKVRCNKEKPCQNCTKAGIDCEVAPPPPPRRRKRKLHEPDLVRKLAKYEELMDRSGVEFRSVDNDTRLFEDGTASNNSTSAYAEKDSCSAPQSKAQDDPNQYHKEFESASNILFGNTTEAETTRATFHRAFDAVFDGSNSFPFAVSTSTFVDLTDLHPTSMQIMQLWQVYLNNVDPLLRLTHTPTLQKQVVEASGKIAAKMSIEKDLEALLFSIYFISAHSLTDAESMASFGITKYSLQGRYHVASQQALLNGNLMRTLSITVLQAYILHLTAIRTFVDPRSHYTMIGIAVRIAIRLGIHRDGAQFRLSPFEVEQRRRLWWNLIALDKRIAETTGSPVTAMSTPRADCERPTNLNDSDLHLHANQAPQASRASTEMVFGLARYELAATAAPDGVHTMPTPVASTSSVSSTRHRPLKTPETDTRYQRLRIGLEDYANYVETTYLRSLDPSIPLHLFTIMMTRQTLRKLQLIANVSSILRDRAHISPDLREWAFDESLRLLEDDNAMQSKPELLGWLWYTHMHFPFPAYMFLVHELKENPTDERSSRAWETMDRNHKLRGLVGPGKKASPMHLAYGKHFLEAWNARLQTEKRRRALQTPELILLIQDVLQKEQSQQLPRDPQQESAPLLRSSTGAISQPSQPFQEWYGSSGMDELDFFASMGDISGLDYIIPSLI